MTDEEKEALKDCDIIFMCLEDMMSEESANDARKSYKIIRNLIETQQKEIEKEKTYNEFYIDLCSNQQKEIKKLKEKNKNLADIKESEWQNALTNAISKDKIKAILDENYDSEVVAIEYLQELLEE